MELLSYYIPRYQNTPQGVAHLSNSQTETIWSLEEENPRSLWKKSIGHEKITKILEYLLKYWGMGLSLYHVPRSLISSPGVAHLNIIQTATIWSSELGNIKGLWKKLT